MSNQKTNLLSTNLSFPSQTASVLREKISQFAAMLSKEIHFLTMRLNAIRAEGSLSIAKSHNYTQWFQCCKGVRSYIKKDDVELAQQLALRKYIEMRLKELHYDLSQINAFLSKFHPDDHTSPQLLTQDSLYQSLLLPFFTDNDIVLNEWYTKPFATNFAFSEKLIHKTKSGLMVRSKSERDICNFLYDNHILFHYEELLNLDGAYYYPDFTIMHPRTHKIYYWEHAGMMDDSQYVVNAMKKFTDYALHGILLNKNLN
ncbi:MAG: hypothetical protein HUJ63_08805, partial [Enterococcus sp.]|nr:hypothetical protein [Enterococcus sp.]